MDALLERSRGLRDAYWTNWALTGSDALAEADNAHKLALRTRLGEAAPKGDARTMTIEERQRYAANLRAHADAIFGPTPKGEPS